MQKMASLTYSQPQLVNGLAQSDRDQIIISSISDGRGEAIVLSKMGDSKWDLSPYFRAPNLAHHEKVIIWDPCLPADLVNDCKSVVYAWLKNGMLGSKPPSARAITTLCFGSAIPTVRWLSDMGITRFSDVKQIHISNYISYCRQQRRLTPHSLYGRLRVIDLLRIFSSQMLYPLKVKPWGEFTLHQVSRNFKSKRGARLFENVGKTEIIPRAEQAAIFNYCEAVLSNARDMLVGKGVGYTPADNDYFVRVRDAVLYIVSITSGMRNNEVIGIELYKWRREYKKDVLFCWVSTIENKTGKGLVEYLVPELTLEALELLVIYSASIREELKREVRNLCSLKSSDNSLTDSLVLSKARLDLNRIFLSRYARGKSLGGEGIGALTINASSRAFVRIAKAAGSDWPLRTHQCRRTYARIIVESRMGRVSLIWLKWQFKHSHMSQTELYASNPLQDASLFDEIFQQMSEFKIDLVESWLGDQRLAGGAGAQIMEMRATPVKDRMALLEQTVPHANIRATGHGWCIATERGCGGAGLYEATRCPGCKHSVIDGSFEDTWQNIYLQQRELLDIVDAGPAVTQRATRDLKIAHDVLMSLGVVPTAELL